jgi:predicted transcriptional regulator
MTTTKKITKRDKFSAVLSMLNTIDPTTTVADGITAEELVDFVNHELELLAKKNSAEKKPTEKQTENIGIKEVILDVLGENGGLMTVTDVQKSRAELAELSNQRVSALLRQLKDEGYVERVEDKRKAYFKLA